MKISSFFKNFFFATGVLWFLCALSILEFNLNFEAREIASTLILPLAWAILKYFDKEKPTVTSNTEQPS